MSRTAQIELPFADGRGAGDDGKYQFRLGIGQLRELQELCGDVGPTVVARRLASGEWKIDDIIQPIRLGLIGAKMDAGKALALVKKYVEAQEGDDAQLINHAPLAQAIVLASVMGCKTEPVGEKKAEAAGETTIQTSGSPSPQSTGPAPSSDTDPATSTP